MADKPRSRLILKEDDPEKENTPKKERKRGGFKSKYLLQISAECAGRKKDRKKKGLNGVGKIYKKKRRGRKEKGMRGTD